MHSRTELETGCPTVQTTCWKLPLEVCQGAHRIWWVREASRTLPHPENLFAALPVHLDRKSHHLGMSMEAQAVWACNS